MLQQTHCSIPNFLCQHLEKIKFYLEEELLTAENETYKCPSCGANLKYDAANNGLKCDYCGFELSMDGETSTVENDFLSVDNHQKWDNSVQKAVCQNCGAHSIIEKTTLSLNCLKLVLHSSVNINFNSFNLNNNHDN